MPTFSYTARESATGKKVSAQLEAESQKAAAKILQERGLTPINITGGAEEKQKSSPLDVVLLMRACL
jgi:type II secretory pathway component PulF